MAFSPIITRLYGPEAFGLLGTFMAIVGIVTPIAALSYPIAIVLPKEDSDARGIARISIFIVFTIAILLFLFLLVAGDWVVKTLKVQEIAPFIFLIPLVIVFTTWLQINQQWLIRKKEFRVTARVTIFQAFILNSCKSGIGFFRPLAEVLLVLAALGNGLHALMLNYGVRRVAKEFAKEKRYPVSSLWRLARNYYDFPLYRTPQVFINAFSHQSAPVLMLAALFGPVPAGFYALGVRVLGLPSALIGGAVGSVFYPRVTQAAHAGEDVTKLIFRATMGLVAIGMVPFGLIFVFGPWMFGFVFGNGWVVAGEYARWLSFMYFFNFINKPAVGAVPVLNIQKGMLVYQILTTGAKLLGLFIGFFLFKDDVVAICFFSISGALAYFILIIWVIYSSK